MQMHCVLLYFPSSTLYFLQRVFDITVFPSMKSRSSFHKAVWQTVSPPLSCLEFSLVSIAWQGKPDAVKTEGGKFKTPG